MNTSEQSRGEQEAPTGAGGFDPGLMTDGSDELPPGNELVADPAAAGEPDRGEPPTGATDRGEPPTGATDRGEPDRGEPDRGEPPTGGEQVDPSGGSADGGESGQDAGSMP